MVVLDLLSVFYNYPTKRSHRVQIQLMLACLPAVRGKLYQQPADGRGFYPGAA